MIDTFTGKKEVRVWLPRQLCIDSVLAGKLRYRANRNFRKLEDEIRMLITVGLKTVEREESNEQKVLFPHTNSH